MRSKTKSREEKIEVVCPECKKPRKIRRDATYAAKFTGLCPACGRSAPKGPAKRKDDEGVIPLRKNKPGEVQCRKCDRPFMSINKPTNKICPDCAPLNARTSVEWEGL
jgi:hypothetical protein